MTGVAAVGVYDVDGDLWSGEDTAIAFLKLVSKSIDGLSRRHHRSNQRQGYSTVRPHLDGPAVFGIGQELDVKLISDRDHIFSKRWLPLDVEEYFDLVTHP